MTEETLYRCDLTGETFRDESKVTKFMVTAPGKGTLRADAKNELVPTDLVKETHEDLDYGVMYRIVYGSRIVNGESGSTSTIEADAFAREVEVVPRVIGVGRYLKTDGSRNASKTLEVIPLDSVPPKLKEFALMVEEKMDSDVVRQM